MYAKISLQIQLLKEIVNDAREIIDGNYTTRAGLSAEDWRTANDAMHRAVIFRDHLREMNDREGRAGDFGEIAEKARNVEDGGRCVSYWSCD